MEIKMVVGKNGAKRAYYYSLIAARWLPLKIDEAERRLLAGEASLVEEGASKALFAKMSASPKPATVRVAKDPVYVDEKGAVVDFFALFPKEGNA